MGGNIRQLRQAPSQDLVPQAVAQCLASYWDWWTAKYGDEDVYGIALYSTSLIEYVGCTIFTEQGLAKVVAEYKEMELYQDETSEKIEHDLRWSACDSPHHMENLDLFGDLEQAVSGWPELFDKLDGPQFDTQIESCYRSLLDGIVQFRNNNKIADNIITTMFWGDMGPEEDKTFVRHCNPKPLAENYLAEF